MTVTLRVVVRKYENPDTRVRACVCVVGEAGTGGNLIGGRKRNCLHTNNMVPGVSQADDWACLWDGRRSKDKRTELDVGPSTTCGEGNTENEAYQSTQYAHSQQA